MSRDSAAAFDAGALEPLRAVIARHGIGARRRLGQHFLLDLNLTRRVARAAGDLAGVSVVEIGAGPGGLTRALLETEAREVVAVERDPRCLAALNELVEPSAGRLRVIDGDALSIDPATLVAAPRQIVANLPYNIATRLLTDWLGNAIAYRRFTLMFQKEVAVRLAATPGGRDFSRLSVLAQWLCAVRLLFDVPARAFTPPPKVTSAVIELAPRAAPLAPARRERLEQVTAAAFGQRRKMLRASLKQLGRDTPALLDAAGILGTVRAETLSVDQFCALARALDEAE